ncbi:hypothetical protein KI387_020293, partial [Taxus chinensis]
GFTTYAERRIVEAVDGKERAALNIGLGCAGLRDDMERFKDNLEFTKLRTNQEGIDPDDVYSCVPYEKGFQFLWRIERQVGRPAFDEFLKKYSLNFKFQSIDTDTFLAFLKKNLPGIENEVDLDLWIDGVGLPPDVMEPVSAIHRKVLSASQDFMSGGMPVEEEHSKWQGQEWRLYLESLPKKLDPSQIWGLDRRFGFSESKNWEVKVAFLTIAAYSGYRGLFGEIEKCLKEVGRMMFLRPLYTGLLQSSCGDEGKKLARKVFEEARNSYHPIAQGVIESLMSKFT